MLPASNSQSKSNLRLSQMRMSFIYRRWILFNSCLRCGEPIQQKPRITRSQSLWHLFLLHLYLKQQMCFRLKTLKAKKMTLSFSLKSNLESMPSSRIAPRGVQQALKSQVGVIKTLIWKLWATVIVPVETNSFSLIFNASSSITRLLTLSMS